MPPSPERIGRTAPSDLVEKTISVDPEVTKISVNMLANAFDRPICTAGRLPRQRMASRTGDRERVSYQLGGMRGALRRVASEDGC